MNTPLTWSIITVLIGGIIIVISVAADTATGSNWWHLGTVGGTAMSCYGIVRAISAWRERPQKTSSV